MVDARAASGPASPLPPPTREPRTHNHLIGNPAALEEAWERDGYWLFRDVLDKDAVARLRRIYVEELEKLGVIAPVGDAPTERGVRYNGADLTGMPRHMEPLAERRAWQTFVAEKTIHDFFVKLLDDEPFWVPVVEYRATPPSQESAESRVTGIHQDGPHTPGVPIRTCWFPIAEIDADVGGIMFAEGLAQHVNRHPIDEDGSNLLIPLDQLPGDCWRHTTYRPGDLLMMNGWTPHSGLTNVSDTFRLSFDHRVVRSREKCPIIGEVVSIAPDQIEVRNADGNIKLRIDATTYARNTPGRRLSGEAITKLFTPGTSVIATSDGAVATLLRPIHSA